MSIFKKFRVLERAPNRILSQNFDEASKRLILLVIHTHISRKSFLQKYIFSPIWLRQREPIGDFLMKSHRIEVALNTHSCKPINIMSKTQFSGSKLHQIICGKQTVDQACFRSNVVYSSIQLRVGVQVTEITDEEYEWRH